MVSSDYDTMARALATIGATDGDVDFRAFARDLESFFSELENVNANVVLTKCVHATRFVCMLYVVCCAYVIVGLYEQALQLP